MEAKFVIIKEEEEVDVKIVVEEVFANIKE
jgi:hypothetical protein